MSTVIGSERTRAPQALAGKLKSVTVGGKAWTKVDPVAETIDFPLDVLQSSTHLFMYQKEMRCSGKHWLVTMPFFASMSTGYNKRVLPTHSKPSAV